MSSKINLSKVKRCDQNWNTMQPCGKGRLCAECQNIVLDFRGKTDSEIAFAHTQSEKKVCGIYDEKHFAEKKSINLVRRQRKAWITAGTAGLLAAGTPTFAAENKTDVSVEIVTPESAGAEGNADTTDNSQSQFADLNSVQKDSLYVMAGSLRDVAQNPLIGASVMVKGTKNGVFTDTDGRFTIDLTKSLAESDSVILIAAYVGHGREEIVISKTDFTPGERLEFTFVLEVDTEMTAFAVRRSPWYARVWYRIINVFRKKNR